MTWSLITEIRDAIAASDDPDPHAIAPVVIAAIPARQRTAVLEQLIPDAVREQIRALRDRPLPTEDDDAPVVRGSNRSHRLEAAQELMFRVGEYVPGHGWLSRGDMSADHWSAVADHRRAQAKSLDASADRADAMADTLRRSKVQVTRELPVEVVREVLGL